MVTKKKKKKKASEEASGIKIICKNSKARFNYQLQDNFEAGVVLTGSEVKSLRLGKANLSDAYGDIRNGEVFLIQANIQPYEKGGYANHEPKRARKLLVHKQELKWLTGKTQVKGMALVPLKMYFKNGKVKVEMALGAGKKSPDKRQALKERDLDREMNRDLKR
ncbi:MAG: SsrA-binding protein SmpB [bacterium]